MHLQVNTSEVHKFEEGFTTHTAVFWILCECTYDVVHTAFLLIPDLSGVLFYVSMLQIMD